jgi:hypothetical protein
MGVILNAWDCGTFANAIDRLGCKVMWLIPLLTIILGWIWITGKGTNQPDYKSQVETN